MKINQSITITSGIIIFHICTFVLFIIDTNFAGKIFTLLQVYVANLSSDIVLEINWQENPINQLENFAKTKRTTKTKQKVKNQPLSGLSN
jgi:hypothetical protein